MTPVLNYPWITIQNWMDQWDTDYYTARVSGKAGPTTPPGLVGNARLAELWAINNGDVAAIQAKCEQLARDGVLIDPSIDLERESRPIYIHADRMYAWPPASSVGGLPTVSINWADPGASLSALHALYPLPAPIPPPPVNPSFVGQSLNYRNPSYTDPLTGQTYSELWVFSQNPNTPPGLPDGFRYTDPITQRNYINWLSAPTLMNLRGSAYWLLLP